MDDAEKEMMMEKKDDKMMEEEKGASDMFGAPKFGGDESDDDYDSVKRKDKLSPCCCCLCVCENTATENVTCCCCCPIQCGIQVIGGLTLLITFYYISWNFFLILNDQVTWWFPVVTIVLLIPLYIASGMFVNWFIKDTLASRGKLTAAIILVLVSVACVATWNVIYYVAIYKRDDVFIGYGVSEDKYQKFQKKYYLFKVLLEAAILLALYAYFMCVIQTYKDLLRKEKPKKDDEEKK
jgi:hypothetical protein